MKLTLLLLLLSTLLLALAPAAIALAPDQVAQRAGVVAGVVLDAQGQPVPGAPVLLRGETVQGVRYHARTRTGRDGRFGFRPVPPGRYLVSSQVPRLGADRAGVVVRPDQRVFVRLVLH